MVGVRQSELCYCAGTANLDSDGGLRKSSLEQYEELVYYCLYCRKRNCVDLPAWHYGQVTSVDCPQSSSVLIGRRAALEHVTSLSTAEMAIGSLIASRRL